jgi:hypothetical protein
VIEEAVRAVLRDMGLEPERLESDDYAARVRLGGDWIEVGIAEERGAELLVRVA